MLGEKLGSVLQQAAPDKIEKLRITYFGKICELDSNPLTRAIQRGYLRRISGADVTDVNAPMRMHQLGIAVETVKSSTPADYTELVQLEATDAAGKTTMVSGTLIGTAQNPRLVDLLGHSVEVTPAGYLLVLRNRDVPGIVGMLGHGAGQAPGEHCEHVAEPEQFERGGAGGLPARQPPFGGSAQGNPQPPGDSGFAGDCGVGGA